MGCQRRFTTYGHVEITFESLEGLEHLDELDRAKDIGVLRCNLDDCLQVLTNVDTKHLIETSHGLLSGEFAEVVDEPLGNALLIEGSFTLQTVKLASIGNALACTMTRLMSAISS